MLHTALDQTERIGVMKLHTLLQALPFQAMPADNPEIKALTQDHRKVEADSLFICVRGSKFDGHQFAEAAVNKGAAAIVSEKPLVNIAVPIIIVQDTKRAMAILADAFYQQPTKQLRLIGITGTNGKTTTSHLIEQMFRDHGQETGLIGTMYRKIGQEILETINTTPDSLTLQQTFRQMCDAGVETAVMEVSSHALIQGRVYGCDYDIAIFTNLTQDHLDYHKTMEAYKQAKGLLFSQLGNAYSLKKPKVAIINADDEAASDYLIGTAAHVITYGIDNDADITATDIKMNGKGTTFTLTTPTESTLVNLQLIGKFSVYNVLAAIACGFAAKFPLSSIVASMEKMTAIAGRFELVDGKKPYTVIVDYAHTPDSLKNVLTTIEQFAEKKIFVVVGCGGDRDRTKRPLMAKIACEHATNPIFTSDNPRSEDPRTIIEDMEAGVVGKQYEVITDRREAIFAAIRSAEAGDVVLIAGKGHETYQTVGDQVFDFDDRKVALEAMMNV